MMDNPERYYFRLLEPRHKKDRELADCHVCCALMLPGEVSVERHAKFHYDRGENNHHHFHASWKYIVVTVGVLQDGGTLIKTEVRGREHGT